MKKIILFFFIVGAVFNITSDPFTGSAQTGLLTDISATLKTQLSKDMMGLEQEREQIAHMMTYVSNSVQQLNNLKQQLEYYKKMYRDVRGLKNFSVDSLSETANLIENGGKIKFWAPNSSRYLSNTMNEIISTKNTGTKLKNKVNKLLKMSDKEKEETKQAFLDTNLGNSQSLLEELKKMMGNATKNYSSFLKNQGSLSVAEKLMYNVEYTNTLARLSKQYMETLEELMNQIEEKIQNQKLKKQRKNANAMIEEFVNHYSTKNIKYGLFDYDKTESIKRNVIDKKKTYTVTY